MSTTVEEICQQLKSANHCKLLWLGFVAYPCNTACILHLFNDITWQAVQQSKMSLKCWIFDTSYIAEDIFGIC